MSNVTNASANRASALPLGVAPLGAGNVEAPPSFIPDRYRSSATAKAEPREARLSPRTRTNLWMAGGGVGAMALGVAMFALGGPWVAGAGVVIGLAGCCFGPRGVVNLAVDGVASLFKR